MQMSRLEAQRLITPKVRQVLESVGKQKDAFTMDALVNEGVPAPLVRVMLASRGPATEKARQHVTERRKRMVTSEYVWGPDVGNFLVGIS